MTPRPIPGREGEFFLCLAAGPNPSSASHRKCLRAVQHYLTGVIGVDGTSAITEHFSHPDNFGKGFPLHKEESHGRVSFKLRALSAPVLYENAAVRPSVDLHTFNMRPDVFQELRNSLDRDSEEYKSWRVRCSTRTNQSSVYIFGALRDADKGPVAKVYFVLVRFHVGFEPGDRF